MYIKKLGVQFIGIACLYLHQYGIANEVQSIKFFNDKFLTNYFETPNIFGNYGSNPSRFYQFNAVEKNLNVALQYHSKPRYAWILEYPSNDIRRWGDFFNGGTPKDSLNSKDHHKFDNGVFFTVDKNVLFLKNNLSRKSLMFTEALNNIAMKEWGKSDKFQIANSKIGLATDAINNPINWIISPKSHRIYIFHDESINPIKPHTGIASVQILVIEFSKTMFNRLKTILDK